MMMEAHVFCFSGVRLSSSEESKEITRLAASLSDDSSGYPGSKENTVTEWRSVLPTAPVPHHDMKVPDFADYRRPSTSDPNASARDTEEQRKAFTYLSSLGLGVLGAVAAKKSVCLALGTMAPGPAAVAGGRIEIKLGDIPEGKSVTFKWRGKPLFVKHR